MLQVHSMIQELADFEKLGDRVKITPEQLQKDGFDQSNPAFSCFVAEVAGGTLVGYALYYNWYSTWEGKSTFLEDLYVRQGYRKKGVGRALFLAAAKVGHETSGRMDFHVLSWNPSIMFYKTLGAVDLSEEEDWKLFRLRQDALDKLFG